MKTKSLLFGILAIAIVFSLNSCSPKTKKVVVDNSSSLYIDGGTGIRPVPNGEPGQNEFYQIEFNLLWDIEVAMNGVDFGVIEGKSMSDSMEVPDANNLKIEKFNILKNDAGLSVYYLVDGKKVYVDFNSPIYQKVTQMQERCEKDMKVMEDKFKKVDQAGGLLNNDWKWDVSYKENGNAQLNKQREEEAKKKKSSSTTSSKKKK